jgi:mitochondrial pyruvate carrier 2
MANMIRALRANLSHPEHGWKTTHFWGPVANWGLVGAAVYDATFNPADTIDIPMTATMMAYSATFLRFFYAVIPRNPLGMACHLFNITAQANQMRRAAEYKMSLSEESKAEVQAMLMKCAGLGVGLGALIASSGRIVAKMTQPSMPSFVQKMGASPVGPLTVFFWAPATKWGLSANNLVDLKKDTNKMSMANQIALSLTGLIWTRYSMVITPINYNLASVNLVLGISSMYHLQRKVRNDYMGDKC